jgi:SET domain-containing protein
LFLKVATSRLHGHGCFTTRAVALGEVVARSRILILPPADTELLLRTRLKNYVFYVKDGASADAPPYSAIAMSPVSFCNHSADPNCDFTIDEPTEEIVLFARQQLAANEEITIDYGDYAEKII